MSSCSENKSLFVKVVIILTGIKTRGIRELLARSTGHFDRIPGLRVEGY